MDDETYAVTEMYQDGVDPDSIADKFGMSYKSVYTCVYRYMDWYTFNLRTKWVEKYTAFLSRKKRRRYVLQYQ